MAVYLAVNRTIVTELAGNVWRKLAAAFSMLWLTGTTFVGSLSEFSSSDLAEVNTRTLAAG